MTRLVQNEYSRRLRASGTGQIADIQNEDSICRWSPQNCDVLPCGGVIASHDREHRDRISNTKSTQTDTRTTACRPAHINPLRGQNHGQHPLHFIRDPSGTGTLRLAFILHSSRMSRNVRRHILEVALAQHLEHVRGIHLPCARVLCRLKI